MTKHKYKITSDFKKRLKAITAKRAKTVIDHVLKHGFITTEELNNTYGYDHPPRAARDVREQGIPLETFKVTGSHGRTIGAYRFGDPAAIKAGKLVGQRHLRHEKRRNLFVADLPEPDCRKLLLRTELSGICSEICIHEYILQYAVIALE